ncbi:hypothetical protein PtB15_5B684 [Puccinia triticina]|nr:hypothetical protein PtB15_5B684 [Puccinia triticina]
MSLLPDRPRHSLLSSRSLHGRMSADPHSRFGSSPSVRSKPYAKPNFAPTRPTPETRWNHDLFEDDSNLYGPKVRYQIKTPDVINFGAPRPSPSLRPFGNAVLTPAPAPASKPAPSTKTRTPASAPPLPPPPSTVQRPPIKNPQPAPVSSNSGISLLSRIQSKDTHKPLLSSDSSSSHLRSNIRPEQAPPPREIKIQQTQPPRSHQAFDEAMAKYLNGPVILEVANLADGTSAEDVKTAFADFGDIQECSTEEGLRQANQPTLKAKMIFTHKAEAEKAVEALNGALADGLTLAVKIIGRPTKKPERADYMTTPPIDTNKPKGAEKPMKADDNDVTMEDGEAPIVPTGRLRSEAVAQCDPRASIQVEPRQSAVYQVEHARPSKHVTPGS